MNYKALAVASNLIPHERRHGWIEEPAARYHASKNPGLGSSHLKRILESPAHFLHAFLNEGPEKPSPAMRFGTMVHSYVLEGQLPKQRPHGMSPNSKAYKEWLEHQPDQAAVCTGDELEALRAIRLNVTEALAAHDLNLEQAECEVSGYASEGTYDLELRIRPDARFEDRGIILDLKTTSDASPDGFQRAAWNLGYHLQASFYLNVANLIEGRDRYREFWWAAVESSAPHAVVIYRASPELLAEGERLMLRALERLNECMMAADYPGLQRPGEIIDLLPPRWAKVGE